MATTLYNNAAIASLTWQVTGSLLPQTITCGLSSLIGDTAATIRTDWDVAMWGAGKPFAAAAMSPDYTLIESRVLLNRGGVLTVDFGNPNLVGTASWASASPNVPVIIAKTTAFAGPRYRGRFFAPAGVASEVGIDTSGHIAGGDVAALQTLFTAAYNSLVTNSVPPILLHGAVIPPTPITGFLVNPLVGTMRRRVRR